MNNILSIDPSSTGTTGVYYSKFAKFSEFKNPNWKEHLAWLIKQVQTKQPNLILYEHTNYIHRKTKDGLSLFYLLGAIEGFSHFGTQTEQVSVLRVKELTRKLFTKRATVSGIEYSPGRGKGWMFNGKRISLHQLEAYLVYYLWKQKNHEQ